MAKQPVSLLTVALLDQAQAAQRQGDQAGETAALARIAREAPLPDVDHVIEAITNQNNRG